MVCALLNKAPSMVALASGACQNPGVLGFQPAPETEQIVAEIGPVTWFQRLGSFARVGAFSPQTLRIRRLVSTLKTSPHCDSLADLFDSGGSLWHSRFAEEPCDCGNGARLGFTHHRTHIEVFAHRIDLCGGRSLRRVSTDLNLLYACHREFLRLRVDLA